MWLVCKYLYIFHTFKENIAKLTENRIVPSSKNCIPICFGMLLLNPFLKCLLAKAFSLSDILLEKGKKKKGNVYQRWFLITYIWSIYYVFDQKMCPHN